MSSFKKLILLLCASSLSACASTQVPNGKLNPIYKELVSLPAETAVTEVQLEKPLTVKVPQTNVTAGGPWFVALASVAISTAATGVSYAKRADEKKAILESINDISMYDDPGKSYTKTIQKTDWIDLQEVNKLRDAKIKTTSQLKAADSETPKKMEGKAFGVFTSSYWLGEQFESLTQRFLLQIYSVKDGKADKTIYSVALSDVYYPEGSMDEGFENHKLWIANDNTEIKSAIKATTKNINDQLKKHLEDPYYDPDTDDTKQTKPTDENLN